jgi:hypothetical protein
MADQLHRQDAPIWNAIEAGNYKQAHKLVDKRLAKKPTDYLEVYLEIPVILKHQDSCLDLHAFVT